MKQCAYLFVFLIFTLRYDGKLSGKHFKIALRSVETMQINVLED
jgi:hypothetical protein